MCNLWEQSREIKVTTDDQVETLKTHTMWNDCFNQILFVSVKHFFVCSNALPVNSEGQMLEKWLQILLLYDHSESTKLQDVTTWLAS